MNYTIKKEGITIPVNDSQMKAHIAYPENKGKYSSVIVVPELFGVNDNIRNITNEIAALGYVAIAPDFYHRSTLGHDIPFGEDGRKKGFEELGKLQRAAILEDVKATIDFLQFRPDITDKMGIVGFSVGGHMAYIAASQYKFNAIACFYAGWLNSTDISISRPEPTITLTKGLAKNNTKLIYFSGADDKLITRDQLDKMEEVFKAEHLRYELVVYPKTSHGFFCDQRPADYNAAAHDTAWKQLQELLATELKEKE